MIADPLAEQRAAAIDVAVTWQRLAVSRKLDGDVCMLAAAWVLADLIAQVRRQNPQGPAREQLLTTVFEQITFSLALLECALDEINAEQSFTPGVRTH